MKYLGIDHGLAHIGLSVGDDESRIALPLDTIHEQDVSQQVAVVADVMAEEGAEEIVVGYPLSMEGESLEQAEAADAFIEALSQRVQIPIHREDERFSSEYAKRQKQEDPDGKFDEHALAAAAILQTFLDRGSQA